MRILFFGTPDFAVPCLDALIREGFDVVGCVTQPDKPQGRSMKLTPPPVKVLAEEKGIPVFQPERLKEGQLEDVLADTRPDVCAVVAYGKILPEYVLSYPKYGCINVHGSLLPKYRGAAPIQWAVRNGDTVTGVSTMFLNAGMDTGDVIYTEETPIPETETAGELFDRLAPMGAELLVRTLRDVEAGIAPRTPQNEAEATYAPMLTREDARVDWSRGARELSCLVRSLNPWPVAAASLHGTSLKIFAACPVEGTGTPGEILSAGGEGITVCCGSGALRITELQPQNGKRMTAAVYCNGHRLIPGDHFDL